MLLIEKNKTKEMQKKLVLTFKNDGNGITDFTESDIDLQGPVTKAAAMIQMGELSEDLIQGQIGESAYGEGFFDVFPKTDPELVIFSVNLIESAGLLYYDSDIVNVSADSISWSECSIRALKKNS